jgi:nicotinamidase-related amidase
MSDAGLQGATALLVCLDALEPVGANSASVAPPAWRAAAADLLAQARANGWAIAHVLRRRPSPGEGGWRSAPGLAPLPSEPVFHREPASAFACPAFAALAAGAAARRLILLGCSHDGALLATALDGVGRGLRILLPVDAIATAARELAGLESLAVIADRAAGVRLTLTTTARLLDAPALQVIRGGRA